jgi:hypothetical protein
MEGPTIPSIGFASARIGAGLADVGAVAAGLAKEATWARYSAWAAAQVIRTRERPEA